MTPPPHDAYAFCAWTGGGGEKKDCVGCAVEGEGVEKRDMMSAFAV